jgi:hypothetical protein
LTAVLAISVYAVAGMSTLASFLWTVSLISFYLLEVPLPTGRWSKVERCHPACLRELQEGIGMEARDTGKIRHAAHILSVDALRISMIFFWFA